MAGAAPRMGVKSGFSTEERKYTDSFIDTHGDSRDGELCDRAD